MPEQKNLKNSTRLYKRGYISMDFGIAPLMYNEQGNLRKVGFELEFAELPIDEKTTENI